MVLLQMIYYTYNVICILRIFYAIFPVYKSEPAVSNLEMLI